MVNRVELKYHRECKYIMKMRVRYNRKIILSCSTKILKRHLYKINCFANDIYFILKINPETFVFRLFCKLKQRKCLSDNYRIDVAIWTYSLLTVCRSALYSLIQLQCSCRGPQYSKGSPLLSRSFPRAVNLLC